MCLYPRLIKNKKYEENKKNGGVIPTISDIRIMAVPVGCGECIECKKKKAREWQIRLSEEIKNSEKGIFVTLTFSNESYTKWAEKTDKKGYERDNEIATMSVRNFLENWRKKYKKSVKHWLVTELGHNGTENVHVHGIIWTGEEPNEIRRIWKNGFVWLGNQKSSGEIENYVSEKTVNYIIKYIYKSDDQHKAYKSKILTSKGIGSGYTEKKDAEKNKYKIGETKETYRLKSGKQSMLPIYYRNKIYTEEEREKLWIEKLNKQERWILGEKIDVKKGHEEYYKTLKEAQEKNRRLGYGGGENWKLKEYEEQRREKLHNKRKAYAEKVAYEATPSLKKEANNEAMKPSEQW